MNFNHVSIIITNHYQDEVRSQSMRTSLESLYKSVENLPVEIIVVDNYDRKYDALAAKDSKWLFEQCWAGHIHSYIMNSENLHFGLARNQGIYTASGKYICIADNDIYYEKGWLEACLKALDTYPHEKIYATPIDYPTGTLDKKYRVGTLGEYKLSMRAGSNCFVIRSEDLLKIGVFKPHRIAGTKWTDRAVELGYLAAVTPQNMVKDLGLRRGYNLSQAIPIKRTLTNGSEIIFNEDEYARSLNNNIGTK